MTPSASWLPWTEREALAARLEALADDFPARQAFELWRAGVLGAWIGGGVAYAGTPEGGWLLQGGEGYWTVIAELGAPGDAERKAIFALVQADARLVVWDEEVGPGWVTALADGGARPFVRRTYVQDLARVAFRPVPDDEVAIAAWDACDHGPAALELLAAANADGLEGMFLTFPAPPTLEHCRRALAGVMAGHEDEVLPWASFVATEGDRVLGALLCVQGEHARQGLLFDLYVDPNARGRQLSRRLVAAMQGALLSRGYRENQFLTMAANAPVHRLFRDEEIVSVEETAGGYWQRSL